MRDSDRVNHEWDELSAASINVDLSEMASDAFEPTNARKNRYADILPCTWTSLSTHRSIFMGKSLRFVTR